MKKFLKTAFMCAIVFFLFLLLLQALDEERQIQSQSQIQK